MHQRPCLAGLARWSDPEYTGAGGSNHPFHQRAGNALTGRGPHDSGRSWQSQTPSKTTRLRHEGTKMTWQRHRKSAMLRSPGPHRAGPSSQGPLHQGSPWVLGALTCVFGAPAGLSPLFCFPACPPAPCVCPGTTPTRPTIKARLAQAGLAASFRPSVVLLNFEQHLGGSSVDSGLQETSLRGSLGNFPHRCMRNKRRFGPWRGGQAVPEPLQPTMFS